MVEIKYTGIYDWRYGKGLIMCMSSESPRGWYRKIYRLYDNKCELWIMGKVWS